jgi:hypothetical protein
VSCSDATTCTAVGPPSPPPIRARTAAAP